MKKSKRMWGFLTFAFLFVLSLSVSCKQRNDEKKPDPTPEPNPPITQKFKVSFRSNPLGKAKIKASADGVTPVISDALGSIEVEAGKTVTFAASDIDDEKLADEWVNVTSSSDDKMTATLKVTKNVMVIFKLKDKPAPKVKVTYSIVNEFDDAHIHQGLLGVIDKSAGDVTVVSGGEVQVGHTIHISANPNHANGRHRIKEWVFTSPSLSVPNTQEDVIFEVAKEHVAQGINFTVEFEKGEPPEPPLPDGKVRLKAGVFLWDNLEELNFVEGAGLYGSINGESESEGPTNLTLNKGSTVKYRLEPKPGKVLYKWDGEGVDGKVIDPTDQNIVTLTADKDKYLKAIMKNVGMSIFSVFIKNEAGNLVEKDVAKVVAKTKNDTNELIDCNISKTYVECPTGKDAILELMPQDPSYQIDKIEVNPSDIVVEKDTENLNKFTVKSIKDDIVVIITMKKVDTVDITIAGDDHVEADSKKTFKVSKGTLWKVLKETSHIADVRFTEGYELDKWTSESASGADLADAEKFEANKTIFANSKIQMKKLEYSVKNNKGENVADEKVSIVATKDSDSSPVATGTSLPYGTKVNFVATIKDTNWAIKRWSWNVQEDPTTQATNHTKASITLKNDAEVTLFADEAVTITLKGDSHVKTESLATFSVDKGSTWRDLRWNEKIRDVKFEEGYKLGKWFKGENESSPELKDDDEFATDTTIFVKSKDVNLMRFTYKVKNKNWVDMQTNEYTITTKNAETSVAIANGDDVPKGTKISIEVSFTDQKLKVRYWTPDNAKDPNDYNKGLVTIGDGDMEVIMAADEAIQVTIDGDEHLSSDSKKPFVAWKGVQWWNIREGNYGYEFFKDLIKFEDGWELDKYLKGGATGVELEWDTPFNEDTTVYIKSKKKE